MWYNQILCKAVKRFLCIIIWKTYDRLYKKRYLYLWIAHGDSWWIAFLMISFDPESNKLQIRFDKQVDMPKYVQTPLPVQCNNMKISDFPIFK